MSDHMPVDLAGLIDLAKGTKYDSVARDEEKLERMLLEEMRASDDPMTREVGSGIADGTMTWRTVASTSAYADLVDRGVESLRTFDFGAAFDALASERATTREKHQDEEDDVFRGGLLKRRGRA